LSFSQKIKMWCALCIHSHSDAGCTRLTLSAGWKKSTYAREGPLHLPTIVHLPCFVSFRGKKKKSRRILFEQASYMFCSFSLTQISIKPKSSFTPVKAGDLSHQKILITKQNPIHSQQTTFRCLLIKANYQPYGM
jgi:hypothetical protein